MAKISELKKVDTNFDGGGHESAIECCVIEKVSNGYVFRVVYYDSEAADLVEEVLVYSDRNELFRDLAKYI